MSRLWSSFVSDLTPYVPGEQPAGRDIVKLNTNENPWPPAPGVAAAIAGAAADLRLYPDPESVSLKKVIAEYHSSGEQSLGVEQVFVGNGSDEVLAHAFNAFFRRDGELLFPDITYSFYPVYCELYGIEYRTVPLDESYSIDPEDYRAGNCAGIIFANPNAPTGHLLGIEAIVAIAAQNPDAVVIVDEAYIDFADDEKAASATALISRFENVLVVRTLSKSRSLAGLRLGYALGSAALVEALNRVKNSFNSYPVDRLAEAAAIASFADESYFQQQRGELIEQRQQLLAALQGMGFDCLPSATNFVMVEHGQRAAVDLANALREREIIVRYFNKPRLDNYLRISVGDAGQNRALIDALADILAG